MNAELINLEEGGLLSRVADLEKRSVDQANEVACLKSSLADCLRRLSLLEGNRAAGPPAQNGRGAVSARSPELTAARRGPPRSKPTGLASPRDATRSLGGKSPVGRLSTSATALNRQASGATSTSVREPVYTANDGVVRFYIRGRPINVYLPSTVLPGYDISIPVPAPDASLRLEWVYGYRGRDCRNNLYYLPTGELIYFVAAVVVLYNVEEQCQRHYLEHTDDVKCIAVHPDRITVASGQVAGHHKQAGKPHVRIWRSVDLRTLRVIGMGDFDHGVCCLTFSKTDGGCRLGVIDEGQDHVISVWEWQKGRKITETKCSNDPVAAAEFHPLDENLIVVCGKNFLTFWTLDGTTLSRKSAIFEVGKQAVEKPKFVLCLAFAENGDLITGDSSGTIIVWRRGTNTISQVCSSVHDGGIFSICVTQSGHVISGGGKDRRLIFFDSALVPTGQVKELPDLHGSVRTIALGPGDMLLVGTTKNTILQLAPGMEFSAAVFGHSDEFWALASHPQSHQFLTAGHDRLVVLWDALSKHVVWAKELNDPIHCAAFFPATSQRLEAGQNHGDIGNGSDVDETVLAERIVALGTTSGRWLVMDTARHEVIAAHSDGIGEQIQCLSYSPNGQYLAIGSRDNSIYVYNVLDHGRKYNRIGRCSGHSSFVLSVDWSSDSRYLRTVSGDYELLFWTANDCRQVLAASTLRDVDWATETCTLAWNAMGIWLEGFDGSDINACNSNQKGDLLAIGDDRGKVRLFRNPADTPKANHHAYAGHSSHVTNVDFLFDDSRLLSTGGKDTAVFQWEVCM